MRRRGLIALFSHLCRLVEPRCFAVTWFHLGVRALTSILHRRWRRLRIDVPGDGLAGATNRVASLRCRVWIGVLTTTQLIDARTGAWDIEIIERTNLPASLFAEIVPAGANLGRLKSSIAAELNLDDVEVVAPATHDTGSAVAGTPLAEGWAYISSGTWSLVGVERHDVLINEEVARHNFTNEGGAFGTIRFLKNVMGLWILDAAWNGKKRNRGGLCWAAWRCGGGRGLSRIHLS